ncbi:MAG TPA: precorrin-4 C(11)-methyltransferase [Acidimicrobiales bacterium]|nr:precorrin-4 C(11)-methyltransferase [Acidimicrobiales bacterium]
MISFVGAGPGAPDLLTLRGAERLAHADVVVWASSLVPQAVLAHCRPGVELHDSATMTLEDVLGVYAATAETTPIVRLHSGDPSVYGAIAEQMDWCRDQGRAFEVVPGVTSVAAAAATLERELTVPGLSQSLVLTRLAGRTAAAMRPGEGVAALARSGVSMAVFLAGAWPDELQAELLSGYPPETPAAVVVRVTWPDERVVRTTVGDVADAVRSTGARRTVLVLVGDALGGTVPVRSHLYSPTHGTAFRLPSRNGSTAGRPSRRRSR